MQNEQNDMMKASAIVEKLTGEKNAIKQVKRLGSEKRIIRVTLHHKITRRVFIINAKSLRGETEFNNIYVNPDLTFEKLQQDLS